MTGRHATQGEEVVLTMRMEERSNAASVPLSDTAGELARTYTRHALTALCREIRGPLHVIVGSLELLEASPPRHRAALIADIRQRTDELRAVMGRAVQVAERGGSFTANGTPAIGSAGDAEHEPRHRFVSLWRHLLSRRRTVCLGAVR